MKTSRVISGYVAFGSNLNEKDPQNRYARCPGMIPAEKRRAGVPCMEKYRA